MTQLILAAVMALHSGATANPSPPFTVSNRIATTSSAATMRTAVLNGKILYGVNITDEGNAPIDPVFAATYLSYFGINWVRFHHIDVGLANGWWTIDRLLAFADALYAKGIRFSIDGASKLGELYPSGTDGFRRDLYDGVGAATTLYQANIARITPLLRHKGCFLACLVNEGAHLTTAAKALTFWNTWSPVFRAINPNLLLSDTPDGCDQGEAPDWGAPWRDLASHYDVILCHYYNSDGYATGTGNNIFDGWNFNHVTQYDGVGKRVFIQEFGSYESNPYEGSNIAFVMMEARRRGYSTCQFSFASNLGGWAGSDNDPFTIVGDPIRFKLLLFGGYLNKNVLAPYTVVWGGDTGQWSSSYSFTGSNAHANQDYCQVGSYVWTWDKNKPWIWLVKAL
jgi:hypothetical protein